MRVGVPKETKDQEYRVGLTPAGVHALVQRNHEVLVQSGAGVRVGFDDGQYAAAGGRIVENWAQYDLLGMLKQVGAIPDPAAN